MFLKSLNYTFDLTTYEFYVTNDSSLNKISLDDFLDRELEIGDQELEFLKTIQDFYIGDNKFNIDAKNYGAIKTTLKNLSKNVDNNTNDIVDISDNGVVNLYLYDNDVAVLVDILRNDDDDLGSHATLDDVFDKMIQDHEKTKTFTLYYKTGTDESEQTLVKFPVDLSYNRDSDSYQDVVDALDEIATGPSDSGSGSGSGSGTS